MARASQRLLAGIVLIILISLLAGLVSFAVDLANRVKPVQVAAIEEQIDQWFGTQSQFLRSTETLKSRR